MDALTRWGIGMDGTAALGVDLGGATGTIIGEGGLLDGDRFCGTGPRGGLPQRQVHGCRHIASTRFERRDCPATPCAVFGLALGRGLSEVASNGRHSDARCSEHGAGSWLLAPEVSADLRGRGGVADSGRWHRGGTDGLDVVGNLRLTSSVIVKVFIWFAFADDRRRS